MSQSTFNIYQRKVTKLEAELLVNQIKLTPYIMGYSRREWLKSQYTIIAEDIDGNIVGACLTYDFDQDWNKIAALFVLEEFRGRGLGKLLFYAAYKDAIKRKKNLYTMSANNLVIKMMQDLDFVMFNGLLELPKSYQRFQLIFYLHTVIWLMSSFRVQEIFRKAGFYQLYRNYNFVYGIKLC